MYAYVSVSLCISTDIHYGSKNVICKSTESFFKKMYLNITASRYVASCDLVDSYECLEEIAASIFKVALTILSIL
jgi:hypothetical protein